jgi:predicted DNA-binding protein
MSSKRIYQDISVGLAESDRIRLAELSRQQGKTKTVLAREAIRWYLEHQDELKAQPQENATAQAIRYATDHIVKAINGAVDRICKMLYRQGRAIATLYELSWMSLPDDDARKAFHEAANKAKQRMAQHVEKDEQELADRMKKVVNS